MSPNSDPQQLFASMSTFVTACMANHDPSHNPAHVQRVVSLARKILQAEQPLSSTISYNPTIVNLAALLHDIGDRKYVTHVGEAAGGNDDALDPKKMVKHALLAHGADEGLAEKVQTIVSHVSYTTECADPAKVKELIAGGYPELAIVQDADRLDAIGAVGIGRCFTFLGAQGQKFVAKGGSWEMGNSIEHFGDKLERLEGMMKTQTGREMAKVRTERLREFRSWWEEEVSLASTSDVQQ